MSTDAVFIETTIPSYYVARQPSSVVQAARKQLTIEWWDFHRASYDLFTTEVVVAEAARGEAEMASKRTALLSDIPRLAINDSVEMIARELLDLEIVPKKAADDAFHISAAGVHKMDYLLTWNCKHIANPHIRRRIGECLGRHDLDMPIICTPEEFIGDAY